MRSVARAVKFELDGINRATNQGSEAMGKLMVEIKKKVRDGGRARALKQFGQFGACMRDGVARECALTRGPVWQQKEGKETKEEEAKVEVLKAEAAARKERKAQVRWRC